MGNEESTPVDEAVPPTTLHARSIEAVARYIEEKDIQNIVVMVRAILENAASTRSQILDWCRYQHFCGHS